MKEGSKAPIVRRIVDLRKKPEYERKSLSEVARIMMIRGMEMEK